MLRHSGVRVLPTPPAPPAIHEKRDGCVPFTREAWDFHTPPEFPTAAAPLPGIAMYAYFTPTDDGPLGRTAYLGSDRGAALFSIQQTHY